MYHVRARAGSEWKRLHARTSRRNTRNKNYLQTVHYPLQTFSKIKHLKLIIYIPGGIYHWDDTNQSDDRHWNNSDDAAQIHRHTVYRWNYLIHFIKHVIEALIMEHTVSLTNRCVWQGEKNWNAKLLSRREQNNMCTWCGQFSNKTRISELYKEWGKNTCQPKGFCW